MATRSLVPNIKGTGRSYDLYSLRVEAFSVGLEPPSLWRLIHHLLKNLGEVLLPIRKTPFRGQPPSTVLRYSDRRPWYFIGSVQKEIFVILWVPDQMLLIPLTISGFDFQQITIEQRLKAWQFRLYRENNAPTLCGERNQLSYIRISSLTNHNAMAHVRRVLLPMLAKSLRFNGRERCREEFAI